MFHINLKQVSNSFHVEELMCRFSIEIMNVIQNVDSVNTLKCVYNNIMECHHIKQFWLVVTEWLKVITATLGIAIAGIFPVITRCFVIPWAGI